MVESTLNRRLHLLSLVALLLAVIPGAALAQIDGQIVGTVRDRDGRPLADASIAVTGTTLGNVSDQDGAYFLNRVPVGMRTITASLLGYSSQERRLRVLAGHTSTIAFVLEPTPVEAEAVVAAIEREPLLVRDRTATKQHFTADDAVELPLETVDELVSLSAGVYQGEDGFIIRGGRGSESATYVDGVLTTDFTTQRDLTGISTFAIEEVDVIVGGFSAEYGYAQSGLINVVTRSGGTDLHGNVRFTTDGSFATNGLDADERRALKTEPCCGYNSLQVALGGPLIDERVTMFGSLETTGAADFAPRIAGFNPTLGRFNSEGSTNGILPGNRGDRTNLQFKTSVFMPRAGNLDATLLYSRNQNEGYSPVFGVNQHLSSATRTGAWDAIVSWNRPFFRTSDRDMTLRVRAHVHRSESHTGVPHSPEAASVIRGILGDACGAECTVTEDAFDQDFMNYRFGEVKFFFEDSLPGTVPNLVPPRSIAPDPIFGTVGTFRDDGISLNTSHAEESRSTLRVDLDTQLDRINRLKVGTEWTWIDLDRRVGSLHNLELADRYHVQPLTGAAYVQHRWDDGDLVVDIGLRWDYWNPRTEFPAILGIVPCEIAILRFHCTPGAETVPGRSLNALAPRLGVAHPLTDRAQIRLNFGRFHQLPELQHYFSSFLIDTNNLRGLFYGNPFLGYIQTTALEMGLTWLVTDNLALDLVGYVRDREDAIRAEWFQPGALHPDLPEMHVFLNADNGNVKGVDLTLNRRLHSYLSADLTWSLQWARGTTSSPLEWVSGFGLLFDPLRPGRRLLPPNTLSADSYDRLHNFDARVTLQVPEQYRQGTFAGRILENLRTAFVYTARSGTPYTRTNTLTRFPIGNVNLNRFPWTHDGNLRVVKAFPFESGNSVELFAVVNNVFGRTNVLSLHPTTGVVDRDGFETIQAEAPVIRRSVLFPNVPAIFPLQLSNVLPEYREGMSRQDLNDDGTISLEEAQQVLLLALIAAGSDSPYSYGSPRTVRFGLEYRF